MKTILDETQLKRFFLRVVLWLAVIILSVFSTYYYLSHNWLMAIAESIGLIMLFVGLVWFARGGYNGPAIIGWGSLYLIFIILLFTGGVEGTGILWWQLMPLVGFVLFGVRGGVIAWIISMMTLGFSWVLGEMEVIKLFYSTSMVRQTMIVMLVSGIILYVFEEMAGKMRLLVKQQKEMLERDNKQRISIDTELEARMSELKIEHDKQVKVRMAMLNLLEDQKDLETALKKEKEGVEKTVAERTGELMAIINSIARGLLVVNKKREIVLENAEMKKLLGSSGEINCRMVEEYLGKQVPIEQMVADAFDKQVDSKHEPELYGTRYLEVHVVPIIEQGEVDEVAVFIKDVTEAMALQRSRDEFFSIASHELRTPLTAIRGNAEMIIDHYGNKITDKDVLEMLSDIHAGSERLIAIVNDFLNVSRLELGKIEFKMESVDLSNLVSEVIKEFEVTSSRQKVLIALEPTRNKMTALADRDRLKQVLFNLIGNGLKFTKNGEVKVRLVGVGGEVVTQVIDSGEGIPKEMQGLLFHKFQQAGSSLYTRDTSKGTGLGLYISKLMMEGMGGRIWLEKSEIGKGSVFAFALKKG